MSEMSKPISFKTKHHTWTSVNATDFTDELGRCSVEYLVEDDDYLALVLYNDEIVAIGNAHTAKKAAEICDSFIINIEHNLGPEI